MGRERAKDIRLKWTSFVWKRRSVSRMDVYGCARAGQSVSQSVSDDGDLGLVSKRDRVDGGVDDGATMDQRCGMVKTLKRKF